MTPNDILNKDFSRRLSGYDREEVDDFLEAILAEVNQLIIKNQDLENKLAIEKQKSSNYDDMQMTLNRSIVVAQDAADRLKTQAENESEMIIYQAEKKANQLLQQAAMRATEINHETDVLKAQVRVTREEFISKLDELDRYVRDTRWNQLLTTVPEGPIYPVTIDEVMMGDSYEVKADEFTPAVAYQENYDVSAQEESEYQFQAQEVNDDFGPALIIDPVEVDNSFQAPDDLEVEIEEINHYTEIESQSEEINDVDLNKEDAYNSEEYIELEDNLDHAVLAVEPVEELSDEDSYENTAGNSYFETASEEDQDFPQTSSFTVVTTDYEEDPHHQLSNEDEYFASSAGFLDVDESTGDLNNTGQINFDLEVEESKDNRFI